MKVFGDPDKLESYGSAHPDATDVKGVVVLGYDKQTDKWLALEWVGHKTIWLAGGGLEGDESFEQTAFRELKEETGYSEYEEVIQLGGPIISYYFNDKKQVYRKSYAFAFLFMLDSSNEGLQELEEHEQFSVVWLDFEVLVSEIEKTGGGVEHWLAVLERANQYVRS